MSHKTEISDKKYRLAMPDAFIIIFGVVLLAAIATYFIPSGEYKREVADGVSKVIPDSFTLGKPHPVGLLQVFKSIQLGLVDSANIIFLIFVIGGIVQVIEFTGTINSGINVLINKTQGNYILLIAAVGVLFGLLASAGISPNAVIAFIPIGITLARSLKLDEIVGVATIYLGYYSGMIAGIFDPTILGLAQRIAELPLFSGILLRVVIFILLISVSITYVILYARRIKQHPEKSIIGLEDISESADQEQADLQARVSLTQFLVLLIFISFIGLFIYGAFQLDWEIDELVGIFLMMGVTIACVARISPNEFIRQFIRGAKSIAYGALVVGLARAAILILEDGHVLDTIVHGALAPLSHTSTLVGGQMLFLFNLLFNLLVTSGTGQAAIVMPVMVPIVDIMGITRQTGTLILMLGDGFTNIITPTSGVLMAVLAVGGVPWVKWVRFAFPLLLIWISIGSAFIAYATLTGYGPF